MNKARRECQQAADARCQNDYPPEWRDDGFGPYDRNQVRHAVCVDEAQKCCFWQTTERACNYVIPFIDPVPVRECPANQSGGK